MAEGAQRRSRITVIDDHPEFLEVMVELLAVDHEVTAISALEVGFEYVVDSRPDLLIVDLRLDSGNLQRADIVTLARAHRHLRTVPIVVCSGDVRALNDGTDAILNAGNTAVVIKPFTLDAMEEIVRHGLASGFPGGARSSAAEEGYRSVFAGSADAILVADNSGHYLDANDQALTLLGLTRDELCRLTVADLVASERAWTDAEWRRYRRVGWWQGAVMLTIPNQRTQRMLATARVVHDGGHPAYVSWLQPMVAPIALG